MLLRAMGLYGDPSTGSNPAGGSGPTSFAQLGTFVSPTATWASGDPWTYAGTAAGNSELVNKEIVIGGAQVTITAVSSDGNNTYAPGSITFGGPLVRSTWALPSPYVSKIRVKAKHLRHSGIIGDSVWSVAPGQLVVGSFQEPPPPTRLTMGVPARRRRAGSRRAGQRIASTAAGRSAALPVARAHQLWGVDDSRASQLADTLGRA
jgi:hypothetical protein